VKASVEALKAVSAPLLGTVFTMVPSSGSGAYAQHNVYYRTEQPLLPSGQKQNGFRSAPPQPEHRAGRQPSRSGEQP
jgi:hypothetical protein